MQTEPRQLISAATSVDAGMIDLRTNHDKVNATIQSALDGWVGASAVALAGSLESWRSTSEAMTAAMTSHRDSLLASAREFTATDVSAASALDL